MNKRYGNAQTIGRNINQNTYFLTKQEKEGFLVLMADGTIDSVNGAYAAILACETIARGFVWEENIAGQLQEQFCKASIVLREQIYKGKQPRVSLLAACFYGSGMFYRCAGDMRIAAYDGNSVKLLDMDNGACETGALRFLFASQGVWQALSGIEIENILAGHSHPYEKAQKLIEEVNSKNLKEQKSAAAVIVE